MSTLDHLDDIDFRNHAERQKAWRDDFIKWFRQLSKDCAADPFNERLAGQKTMLSSVLWYLLEPKEYKAIVRGRVFINQDKFTPQQRRLFTSMMAFNGSPYCDKTDLISVYESYMSRAKLNFKALALAEPKLAHAIAHNIANDAVKMPESVAA